VKAARVILAVAAVGFMIAAATATATTTPAQANAAARTAAIHYTHRFGIHFRDADVKAGCGSKGGGWHCFVRMNGHQCHGSLRLTQSLHAYRYRIRCGE
jgi:hypothetical protein